MLKKIALDAVTFRPLNDNDLAAVADIQVQSWRDTYADVLASDYLGEPMAADIAQRWSNGLADDDFLVGAFDATPSLLGFAAIRLGAAPYLDNMHVLERAWGVGVAQLLVAQAADALAAQGAQSLWLTVVDTNLRARAFYRRLGGVEGAAGADEMFGKEVTSLPVRWGDLTELSKNARLVVSPLDGAETGT